MEIFIGGYIAFDDDQNVLAVGATPAEAMDAVREEDIGCPPVSTMLASEALIEDFEHTGPGGPTWLSIDTNLGDVACLEEEIDGAEEEEDYAD